MAFNLYLAEWEEQELDCYPPRRDFTAPPPYPSALATKSSSTVPMGGWGGGLVAQL